MELEQTTSMTAMGRAAALHIAFWQYDPWYRRAAEAGNVVAAVNKVKPKHVVFDGLSEMRLLSGNPLIYRRQLLAMKHYFARSGARFRRCG